jgi:hypothetical protein
MTAQQPQRCCEQCKNIPCKVLDRVECTSPHTPAPDCSKMPLPVCDTCELEWTQCGLDSIECHRTMIEHIKIEAARTATLAMLDDLGKVLNSRIAKMEVLDANNPTPLRKGILLAYRDVEEWERQQRKSLRTAAQEHP